MSEVRTSEQTTQRMDKGQDGESRLLGLPESGWGLDVKVGDQSLWGLQQQAETLVHLERVEAREV